MTCIIAPSPSPFDMLYTIYTSWIALLTATLTAGAITSDNTNELVGLFIVTNSNDVWLSVHSKMALRVQKSTYLIYTVSVEYWMRSYKHA